MNGEESTLKRTIKDRFSKFTSENLDLNDTVSKPLSKFDEDRIEQPFIEYHCETSHELLFITLTWLDLPKPWRLGPRKITEGDQKNELISVA